MAIVVPQRVGTTEIEGLYDKRGTNADAARFLGSEAGKREVKALSVLTNEGSGSYLAELTTFSYLVGIKQLQVYVRVPVGTAGLQMWQRILDKDTAALDPEFTAGGAQWPYYEEVTSAQVRVVLPSITGLGADPKLLFEIPHTAVPAELREKIVVKDQGDNVAIEFQGDGDGIVLRSQGGRKISFSVDDSLNPIFRYV